MAILEHEHHLLLRGSRTETVHEKRLERGLSKLRLEGAGELVVRDRDAEERIQQWSARDERGIDRTKLSLEREHLLGLRERVVDP